ncbi:hypothetical protein Hypma_000331 [Hypsizygus marmoreus]|uniref:Protein kinase domain-containing protein n=1 Tax=Hypsizygus marmoreus TaxID=39966 RepID=A0A369JFL0_HYPMA|nr:hypothetical protein Hypma_000331 [Hypsizygus marmoreus]
MPPADLRVNSTLKIEFTPARASKAARQSLTAVVSHAFAPFTMSSVLRVSLRPSQSVGDVSAPSEAILKLYDRRCMANIRGMYDETKPHDASKELAYRQYLDDARKAKDAACDFDDPLFFEERDVSDGEFEGYIEHQCRQMFDAECSTYRHLLELQGQLIPRLHGTVEYIPPPMIANNGTEIVMDPIPGILVEYIPSITLRNLVQTWRTLDPPLSLDILCSVADSATAVIERISDYSVLNEDVRLDNMLVRQPLFTGNAASNNASMENLVPNPCVLIDLAQCRLRREDETDEDWRAVKWSQDEAGAIGFVLAGLINKHLGEGVWTYQRSMRYYRPLEESDEANTR